VSDDANIYELRVTGPAQRQLSRLPAGTAAAIVEFMLTALVQNPHRVGGRLQRELAGLHSARRGAYRVVYEIDDDERAVIVLRIDHRSNVYRSP
jgi:mRNA interferase RelE/StbE